MLSIGNVSPLRRTPKGAVVYNVGHHVGNHGSLPLCWPLVIPVPADAARAGRLRVDLRVGSSHTLAVGAVGGRMLDGLLTAPGEASPAPSKSLLLGSRVDSGVRSGERASSLRSMFSLSFFSLLCCLSTCLSFFRSFRFLQLGAHAVDGTELRKGRLQDKPPAEQPLHLTKIRKGERRNQVNETAEAETEYLRTAGTRFRDASPPRTAPMGACPPRASTAG